MYGADTRQLRELAASFANTAQALRDSSGTLSSTVANALWRGGDADEFRGQWNSVQRSRMESAAAAIDDAAATLRRNADEQDRASGAGESGGVIGSGGAAVHAAPASGASREEVETWWNSLSDEEREDWIKNRPEQIGNRDGIPIPVRFDANERSILNEMDRANGQGDFGRYDLLDDLLRMKGKDEAGTPIAGVLYFDPANDYVSVVHGDLATASEVVVTVSGTSSNLDNFVSEFGREGALLGGGQRAVVSTLVWKPPPTVPDNLGIEHYIGSFVDGPIDSIISTVASEGGSVSLVGHSSGAIAVQEYMTGYRSGAGEVDAVVLLAPPALNPHLPEVLDGRNLFVAMNDNDPMRLGDGNEDTRDGLRWEDVASIDDVIKGSEPWNGSNIRWDSKPSGLGGIAYGTHHHGNSTYFDNYGEGISWATHGELANIDELSF